MLNSSVLAILCIFFFFLRFNWEIYEHMLIILWYNISLFLIFLFIGRCKGVVLCIFVLTLFFINIFNLIVVRNIVLLFYSLLTIPYFFLYVFFFSRSIVLILLLPIFLYFFFKLSFVFLSFFYFFILLGFIFIILNFNNLSRLNLYGFRVFFLFLII